MTNISACTLEHVQWQVEDWNGEAQHNISNRNPKIVTDANPLETHANRLNSFGTKSYGWVVKVFRKRAKERTVAYQSVSVAYL